MSKNIGVVLIPNEDCRIFANYMTEIAEKTLEDYKRVDNNTHVTLFHIANVDSEKLNELKESFQKFTKNNDSGIIELTILDVKATGGNLDEGFKWLDLQFGLNIQLANLRSKVIQEFKSYHNGILERMKDDMQKFNKDQLDQLEKYGVLIDPYVPHATTWYVELPNEPKTKKLFDIAEIFKNMTSELECYTDTIALVELGRNGNVIEIIEQYALAGDIKE